MKRALDDNQVAQESNGAPLAKKLKQQQPNSSLHSSIQLAKQSIEALKQALLTNQATTIPPSDEDQDEISALFDQVEQLKTQFDSQTNLSRSVVLNGGTSGNGEEDDKERVYVRRFLTDNLLASIFHFLTSDDVILGQFVCKQWYYALSKSVALTTFVPLPDDTHEAMYNEDYQAQHFKSYGWTERKALRYFDQMIRNEALLESVAISGEMSFTLLLHIASRATERMIRDNARNETNGSSVNRVKNLSVSNIADLGDAISDKRYLSRVAACFPQLKSFDFGTSKSYKIVEVLQSFTNLKSLVIVETSFMLPRELRRKYREGEEEEESDEEDEENYGGMDYDEGLLTPEVVHKQCLRAYPDLTFFNQLEKLVVKRHTSSLYLILALQTMPNLRHLEVTIDFESLDPETDTIQYIVDQMNQCNMEKLVYLDIRISVMSSMTQKLVEAIVYAIGRATSLEHLSFGPEEWNEELNSLFIKHCLDKMYEASNLALRSLTVGRPSIYPNTFQRICNIVSKHKTIHSLDVWVRNQGDVANIDGCTCLTKLHLSSTAIGPTTVQYIESLYNLKDLAIESSVNIDFRKLPKLHTLALRGRSLSVDIYSPSLMSVNLFSCSVSNVTIACPNMYDFVPPTSAVSLKLLSCIKLVKLCSGRELLQCHIENCPVLSVLDMKSSNSLAQLNIIDCPKIQKLALSTNSLVSSYHTPRSFINVGSKMLRQLHLNNCEVSQQFLVDVFTDSSINLECIMFEQVIFDSSTFDGELWSKERVNTSVRELTISRLPNGSNCIPFKLLSTLVPNIKRLSLLSINSLEPDTELEMIKALNSWTHLDGINFDNFTFKASNESMMQSLNLCSLKTLRLSQNQVICLTLPSCIAQTIQSLEVTGLLNPNGIMYPCLKTLCMMNSSYHHYDSVSIAGTLKSLSLFPELERLELKVVSQAPTQIKDTLRKLVSQIPKLKAVTFKLNFYADDEPPPELISLYDELHTEYPALEIMIHTE